MSFELRTMLRRYVPTEIRLRRVLLQRALTDNRAGFRFARRCGSEDDYPSPVCRYSLPFIDYPGQEQVAAAKRRNQSLLASHLDGVVIAAGEVFSVWRLAPRPSAGEGYAAASAFRDRKVQMEVGGAICLLSTVLYNVALLGGMQIIERHCHSIDQYGEARYFEVGRDAAIEFGYLDLRFANRHDFPVRLTVSADEAGVTGALHAPRPALFSVEIRVGQPRCIPAPERVIEDASLPAGARVVIAEGNSGFEVDAQRHWRTAQGETVERLPHSYHHPVPRVVALGPH